MNHYFIADKYFIFSVFFYYYFYIDNKQVTLGIVPSALYS